MLTILLCMVMHLSFDYYWNWCESSRVAKSRFVFNDRAFKIIENICVVLYCHLWSRMFGMIGEVRLGLRERCDREDRSIRDLIQGWRFQHSQIQTTRPFRESRVYGIVYYLIRTDLSNHQIGINATDPKNSNSSPWCDGAILGKLIPSTLEIITNQFCKFER